MKTYKISIDYDLLYRSTDTEDYMKIELAPSQSVCQEPPKPPPLPPSLGAFLTNGDTVDHASKTNTINSTTSNSNTGVTPQSQDTATRKQQQPLSSISIQDLNSVQVRNA